MTNETPERLSREFKLAALRRMLAGENVSALARELGVRRKFLYQWRDRYRRGGPEALRGRGRPPKVATASLRSAEGSARAEPARPTPVSPADDALRKAQARIAELERKVGRQELELDFFQRALRHVGDARRRSGAPGGTTSTRSSKR